jgi:hypothetical protein
MGHMGHMSTHRVSLVTAALALAAIGGGGCNLFGHDECEVGAEHCSGNTVMHCDPGCSEFGCGTYWDTTECGDRYCVDPSGSAPFCADSPDPEPNCKDREATCSGTNVVSCRHGYVMGGDDCSLSGQTTSCASTADDAFCAVDAEPSPACEPVDGTGAACDGTTYVYCDRGFVVEKRECAPACTEVGQDCFLASQRDARCDPTLAYTAFCDGEILVTCKGGYVTDRRDCAARAATCSSSIVVTFCDSIDEDAGIASPPDAGP